MDLKRFGSTTRSSERRPLSSRKLAGVAIVTPLFDRFISERPADMHSLVRDIADILGSRRAVSRNLPGVLGWGLPDMQGLSPSSADDRKAVARTIARAIERFEPRLTDIVVTPIDDAKEFAFVLEASLVQSDAELVKLRVLSPRKGGGLGAEVAVIGER